MFGALRRALFCKLWNWLMPPNGPSYFHLSGAHLEPGSIIVPGNWGRVVQHYSWQHNFALREMALEASRLAVAPHLPSRMDAAFVFHTLEEARTFRSSMQGWQSHLLCRVTLVDNNTPSHTVDSRLCAPQGAFRSNWADTYWLDPNATAIPGIDWISATGGVQLREMLTLSKLRIEERLD
jgi:hypothetical protein